MEKFLLGLKKIFLVVAILCSGLLASCSCNDDPYANMKISKISLSAAVEGQTNLDLEDNLIRIVETNTNTESNLFYIEVQVTGYNGDREDIVNISPSVDGYVSFISYDYEMRGDARIVKALFQADNGIEKIKFDIISVEGMIITSFEMSIVKPIKDFNFSSDVVPVIKGTKNIILEEGKPSKYIEFEPASTTERKVKLSFANNGLDETKYSVEETKINYIGAGVNVVNPIVSISDGVLIVSDSQYVPQTFGLKGVAVSNSNIEKIVQVDVLEKLNKDEVVVANYVTDIDKKISYYDELVLVDKTETMVNYKITLPNNYASKIPAEFRQLSLLFGYGRVSDPLAANVYELTNGTKVYNAFTNPKGIFTVVKKTGELDSVRCYFDDEKYEYGISHTTSISKNYTIDFRLCYKGYENYFDGINIRLTVEVCAYPDSIEVYNNQNGVLSVIQDDKLVIYKDYKGNLQGKGTEMVAKIFADNKELTTRSYKLHIYDENSNDRDTDDVFTSEELAELVGMVDKLIVMKDFKVTKEFMRSPDLKQTDIIEYMI